jgi:hypothetical protein
MKVCGAGQGELDGFGQVIVDTDANLAAVAEQAVGAGRGIRSFAALLIRNIAHSQHCSPASGSVPAPSSTAP